MHNTKNLAIIAHIDHGKTTLLDRFIQIAGIGDKKRVFKQDRITDRLELEQEKGITIKMQPVTLEWKNTFINIIDTPGHIDFAYEVSRSLRAVESAILLIDVTKGIQAQTIENLLIALEHNLKIFPVLNKIDIADSNLIETRIKEIKEMLGIPENEILLASGKTGQGVEDLLDKIAEHALNPKSTFQITDAKVPLGLVLDAYYDNYDGVVLTVRTYNQDIKPKDSLWIVNSKAEFKVRDVGMFYPELVSTPTLKKDTIGYIKTGIKDPSLVYTGATVAPINNNFVFPGYKKPEPKIFSSFYPQEGNNYVQLREALKKLQLNDFSLQIEDESSVLLGKGFKIGFLGLLHLEITKERLKREFETDVVVTYPVIPYRVHLKDGSTTIIKSVSLYPAPEKIKEIEEPFMLVEIITPFEYFSVILELLRKLRAIVTDYDQILRQVKGLSYYRIKAKVPYSEVVDNLFNKLKSISHGYASISYVGMEYIKSDAVKVDILINHQLREELSFITYPQKAEPKAREILRILKETIPPTIIPIPLQATIGNKIIARETIRATRKDVTAKLYGGDIRRKMKLLRNQSKLKKMRATQVKVKIPSDFFKKVINFDSSR